LIALTLDEFPLYVFGRVKKGPARRTRAAANKAIAAKDEPGFKGAMKEIAMRPRNAHVSVRSVVARWHVA
jgi:hypothetical protein